MDTPEHEAPLMRYLSMWTGPDGLSSIGQAELSGFEQGSVGGKAAPLWMREMPGRVERVFFLHMEIGWQGEWHESPKPQWIIPLSGRWFIQTQDGTRVEMGPGDIHWGQDLGTTPMDGNTGHRSGQVGDEPCVQMMIQFAEPHNQGSPTSFE